MKHYFINYLHPDFSVLDFIIRRDTYCDPLSFHPYTQDNRQNVLKPETHHILRESDLELSKNNVWCSGPHYLNDLFILLPAQRFYLSLYQTQE